MPRISRAALSTHGLIKTRFAPPLDAFVRRGLLERAYV